MTRKEAEQYFNKPAFDFFYKWYSISIKTQNLYWRDTDEGIYKKETQVIWKSKRTGKVVKKIYDYQVNFS